MALAPVEPAQIELSLRDFQEKLRLFGNQIPKGIFKFPLEFLRTDSFLAKAQRLPGHWLFILAYVQEAALQAASTLVPHATKLGRGPMIRKNALTPLEEQLLPDPVPTHTRKGLSGAKCAAGHCLWGMRAH